MDSGKTRETTMSNQHGTSNTRKTVMISHHIPMLRRRDLTLENSDYQWSPNVNTQLSLRIAHRTERIPKREASTSEQNEASKT